MIIYQFTKREQSKIIVLCVFSLILTSQCKRDKLDIPDTGRKIVINGLITTDSLLNVRISKSYYYNSDLPFFIDSDNINNVKVLFYSENGLIDSLVPKYHPNDRYFFYQSNYWSKKVFPQAGKEYQIVVKAPGYPNATANIVVPNLVKIENLDTSRFIVPPDPYYPYLSNVRFKCMVTFTDPPNDLNYYLIRVSKITYREWWIERSDIRIDTQDPLVEQKLSNYDDVYTIAFSDKVVNGEKYSLQFIIDADEIGMPFWENSGSFDGKPIAFYKTVVYFKLYSISKEFYRYIETLNLYNKNYGNPLTDPVAVYSNINNGYGIFGAASVSCDSLVFLPLN